MASCESPQPSADGAVRQPSCGRCGWGTGLQLPCELRHRQIFAGDPAREIDVQHVLIKGCGIAADPDQQAPLRGLGDDGVQRLRAGGVDVKCR